MRHSAASSMPVNGARGRRVMREKRHRRSVTSEALRHTGGVRLCRMFANTSGLNGRSLSRGTRGRGFHVECAFIVQRRNRVPSPLFRTLIAALALACAARSVTAAQGNPEAAKVKNPAASTPESIAAGKMVFAKCAPCHGITGEGGPGNDLIPAAPSLVDAMWDHGSTDGEIFDSIKNGVAPDFQHGAVEGSVEGQRHLECRELHPLDRRRNRVQPSRRSVAARDENGQRGACRECARASSPKASSASITPC